MRSRASQTGATSDRDVSHLAEIFVIHRLALGRSATRSTGGHERTLMSATEDSKSVVSFDNGAMMRGAAEARGKSISADSALIHQFCGWDLGTECWVGLPRPCVKHFRSSRSALVFVCARGMPAHSLKNNADSTIQRAQPRVRIRVVRIRHNSLAFHVQCGASTAVELHCHRCVEEIKPKVSERDCNRDRSIDR